MQPLLITSFEPVDGRSSSVSTRLLAALESAPLPGVESRVLPADFTALRRLVPQLARTVRPERWLLIGEDPNADRVRCERVAVNAVEPGGPAEPADGRSGSAVRGGPDAYFTTLDPTWMRRTLGRHHVEVELSESAGDLAGNLALYLAIHHTRRIDPGIEVGLLHVPRHYRRTGLTLKELRTAVVALISELAGIAPAERLVGAPEA